ncbi:ATP-binding cassette domain-containing protein [Microlunatus soli]|uniref:ATP-binding cassette, subfamily C n=1 Tax=Microlunatus soli TaxID=630515 RepID=A0A1H1S603_9ACTN|nr:ABC transporter ATP-binding protein [Microlunatus soli]SDS43417.1 ATP-binding cassette, subfamily C [Microlunatus soli]
MLRLLRFAFSVSRSATLIVLSLAVGAGLASTMLAYLVGLVVGEAQELAGPRSAGRFVALVAVMLLLFVVNSVLPVLWMTAVVSLEMQVDRTVGLGLGRALLAPYRVDHLDDPAVQDAYGRCWQDAPVEIRLGPTFAAQVLQGLIGLITAAILIGSLFAWWVPIPLAVSTALTAWYLVRAAGGEAARWDDTTQSQRRADYAFDLALGGAPKEIRVYGLSSWLINRYLQARREATEPVWRRRWSVLVRDLIVLFPHVVVFSMMIVYATVQAFDGRLSLAAAVSVISAMLAMAVGFDPWLLGQARRAWGGLQSFERLPELIAAKPGSVDESPTARHQKRTLAALPTLNGQPHHPRDGALPACTSGAARYGARPRIRAKPDVGGRRMDLSQAPREVIRFEDVSFRYPGTDRDVLRHLDLDIRANEATALVGVNGAGKSTLAKLLAACYRPSQGRITVDGIDLATLEAESLGVWQQRLAVIMQDLLQLPLSMRENVTLATRGSPLPAGRTAGLAELAETLPDGWETPLDKAFPGGVDLSGGQWQRVALGRALHAVASGRACWCSTNRQRRWTSAPRLPSSTATWR